MAIIGVVGLNRCVAELYLPRPFGSLTAAEGQALVSALRTLAVEVTHAENVTARWFQCFASQEETDARTDLVVESVSQSNL